MVNQGDNTNTMIRQIKKTEGGIILAPFNDQYKAQYFTWDDLKHNVFVLGVAHSVKRKWGECLVDVTGRVVLGRRATKRVAGQPKETNSENTGGGSDMTVLANVKDILYEMGEELANSKNTLDYLYEVLFGKCNPSPDYKDHYAQIQSVFAMCRDTLSSFEGKYNLLMGEGETSEMASESELMDKLHAANEQMNTPVPN